MKKTKQVTLQGRQNCWSAGDWTPDPVLWSNQCLEFCVVDIEEKCEVDARCRRSGRVEPDVAVATKRLRSGGEGGMQVRGVVVRREGRRDARHFKMNAQIRNCKTITMQKFR